MIHNHPSLIGRTHTLGRGLTFLEGDLIQNPLGGEQGTFVVLLSNLNQCYVIGVLAQGGAVLPQIASLFCQSQDQGHYSSDRIVL